MIPPHKITELLNGSAGGPPNGDDGGTPGQLALTRAELARGLGMGVTDELKHLLTSMTSAGYLLRERRGNAWVYVLGRDMSAGPSATAPPGVDADQFRAGLAWLASRTPQGVRPGGRTTSEGVHFAVSRGADAETACNVAVRDLPPGDAITGDLRAATCPTCISARDEGDDRILQGAAAAGARPGSHPGSLHAGDAGVEPRDGAPVIHGAIHPDKTMCFVPLDELPELGLGPAGIACWSRNLDLMTCAGCLRVGDDTKVHATLPGVPEFTGCGDIIGNLHNPGDTVADPSKRWPEPGSTITCYPCKEALADFEREADRRRHAIEKKRAGMTVHLAGVDHHAVCPARNLNRHTDELTSFPSEVNCEACITINGGNGYRGYGYDEGRAAADSTPDTSTMPPHNYVQGLAAARQAKYQRWLEAARAQYEDRCTYSGAFSSEHPYENVIAEPAQSMCDNDGHDDFERCSKPRTDLLHIGEPEADAQWLAEQFEFETCPECGGDAEQHEVVMTAIGNRFARCVADPAVRVSSVGPDELSAINVTEHVLLDGRGGYNEIGEDAYASHYAGKRDYARGAVDMDRYAADHWYAVGVRDEYVIERRADIENGRAENGWTPPEPRWTSRTFEGAPADLRDEAEEAWRHRVERIDRARRAGRFTDAEATALLTSMTPYSVIDEEVEYRRNGTAARFDPEYVEAVEQLNEDADNGDGMCRYCGQDIGREHRVITGPAGGPIMEHPPWDYENAHGTLHPEQTGAADVDNLVPGDPVRAGGRRGVFEYLDDDGETALVMFEGTTEPERVPRRLLRQHGQTTTA